MLKFITILLLSVSFSLFADTSSIKKDLKSQILENSKNDKVSFVVFNLDNVLINTNVRYESIFNRYLKKNRSRVIKKYFNEKSFINIKLETVLADVENLKLSKRQKTKLKKFLEIEVNSDITLDSDIAMMNSVDFVSDLHKNGAFIIYITKRNEKSLVKTVNTLNKFKFPIGVNNTTIIMSNSNNTKNTERNILSKWIKMGKIIAVFNNNLEILKSLKPYFKSNQLFYINSKNIKDNKIKTIKGF